MQFEFKAGIAAAPISDDLLTPPAMGGFRQVLTADLLPPFYEYGRRGQIYVATTAAAGVAPGTAASTTPPFTLWNPANSGKNLVLLRAKCGVLSGTMGLGTVFWEGNLQTTQPTTGTALAIRSTRVGDTSSATGQAFQGSTVAATPDLLSPAFQVIDSVPTALDYVGLGEYIVVPGSALSLEETGAAGSTPLVFFSVVWAEVAA